jgi:hypothetical protein
MSRRWRLVAISPLCWLLLVSLPEAQGVGPSAVPSHLAATSYKALPAAWLRLAMNFDRERGAGANSLVTSIELTLPSNRGERVISVSHIASEVDLQSATEAGKLTFFGVPTQLPLWLRISVRLKNDAIVCMYARSYVLHFPEETVAARIGFRRALENSGYLGDFFVDQVNAEITRKVSFQPSR